MAIVPQLPVEILHSLYLGSQGHTHTAQFICISSLVRVECGWLTEDKQYSGQLRSRSFFSILSWLPYRLLSPVHAICMYYI